MMRTALRCRKPARRTAEFDLVKPARLDLNLLTVLDAVLRTRSVTRAAERVGLSKPALSHALARLRTQLGDPILVRAGQRWVLTPRAELLADEVAPLVEQARRVLARSQGFEARTLEREFRIHATDHAVSLLGVPLGRVVGRDAPGVTLRFLPILPDDVSALRGDVDLALGVFAGLPPELRKVKLFEDRFACVVRRGHPRVTGKLSLDTYCELHHVLVAPRGKAGSKVDDLLRERGRSRRVTRCLPYFVAALHCVAESDCVATLSWRLAAIHADRFGLQVLKPPLAIPPYVVDQVWHPRVDADPGHVWLRRTLAAVATRELSTAAMP